MGELIYISIGSNLGNRLENLTEAVRRIHGEIGEVTKVSPIYETPPWGFDTENKFLNGCIELKSNLSAVNVLEKFARIESQLGRSRSAHEGYTSRTIDLDILTFGSEQFDTEDLQIPHPRMAERKFVLIPLQDIAPDFVHPQSAKTIQQLIQDCRDNSSLDLYPTKISWLDS